MNLREKKKILEGMNDLTFRKENERRRIFKQHLGWPHQGSSFHRDFPNLIEFKVKIID